MKPIYMTGFMGAGKTTIGQALGEHLGLEVSDTDEWIEKEQGKKIKHIFAEEGEMVFRDYETQVLKKVTRENVIVTTGGGMVIKEENRKWMKTHGTVIYLHCPIREIFHRLLADTKRPLLEGKKKSEITALFQKRLPFYKEADIIIETDRKGQKRVIKEITARLFNQGKNRSY